MTGELEGQLGEAEARLRRVEQVSPWANSDYWRGRIAEVRGDKKSAGILFRKASEMRPKSSESALACLICVFFRRNDSAQLTEISMPLSKRFPDNATHPARPAKPARSTLLVTGNSQIAGVLDANGRPSSRILSEDRARGPSLRGDLDRRDVRF